MSTRNTKRPTKLTEDKKILYKIIERVRIILDRQRCDLQKQKLRDPEVYSYLDRMIFDNRQRRGSLDDITVWAERATEKDADHLERTIKEYSEYECLLRKIV